MPAQISMQVRATQNETEHGPPAPRLPAPSTPEADPTRTDPTMADPNNLGPAVPDLPPSGRSNPGHDAPGNAETEQQSPEQESGSPQGSPIEGTPTGETREPVTLEVGNNESPGLAQSDPGHPDGSQAGAVQAGSDPASSFWPVEDLGTTSALPGLLMAGGVLVVLFILMGRLRKGHRASAPSEQTPREQIDEIRARAGDRARIDAFKVDAQEFTRQMAALLDGKAQRLEQLIADADERLSRLEKANSNTAPSRQASGPSAERRSVSTPRSTPREHARPAPAPPSTLPNAHRADPLHDQIYSLADDGLDAVQIAQQTGRPTGQVELILALRS